MYIVPLCCVEYSTQTGKKGVGKKNSRKDKNTLSRPKTTIVGGLKDSMGDGTSALAGYGNMTGGVCQGFVKHWFLPELSMKHKICATQEFGTKHMIFVGQAAVTENYAHHYGTEV